MIIYSSFFSRKLGEILPEFIIHSTTIFGNLGNVFACSDH